MLREMSILINVKSTPGGVLFTLTLELKCDKCMHAERWQMEYNSVADLLKGNRSIARATRRRLNFFVGLDADFYVVKPRKVGEETDVTAVDRRCIKHVECKESVTLAQTYSAA